MAIDFHDKKNRFTYTNRFADESWMNTIQSLIPIEKIHHAVDVGCGGGIYSKALLEMGVDFVTGVDFSKESLQGAKENCKQIPNISFSYGSALHTGLQGEQFNLVLERALIHHLTDLQACFREALRLLKENGYLIIQDRTPEDCMLQGNETHIRGYFFELFPRLQEIETQRRHSSKSVINNLKRVGFKEIKEYTLWETRKVYDKKKQLLKELSERTGRSILHELNNKELQLLQRYIDTSIKSDNNIVEQDRWTIWTAVKK
ncbi:class I SAM-dependent methyltransferase [Pseudogracilibacillus auburnensis]|uniref:class I SAM-dependent methyltransferase n=1 Tax=Pseudogracilibacillus auburnensis TaxID=1494959 RepID=UPI001A978DA7|nr:class I SAM-dependent methyltransferase [Pseudogracilibacillus auburnensis]MBO1002558.1 methyltransferase domain-containing protein [Pseudogracilibacillus auburnensis]